MEQKNNKLKCISKDEINYQFCGTICRKLITIFNTINLVITLICLILAYNIKINSEVATIISKEFKDNFINGYYLNFFKCTSNENRVFFDEWKGTIRGCGSEKNNVKRVRVPKTDEYCDPLTEVTIDGIPPQPINKFKGLIVCGKTKEKYYDLLFSDKVVGKNEDCPEGRKICGYIDTVHNKLCLEKNKECPVSYIKIMDLKSDPPSGITNLQNITSNEIRFFFSNNPYANSGEIPYVQYKFKISERNVCALDSLYYSSIDLFILDALKNNYSNKCILKEYSQQVIFDDNRYHKLNEINQYDLYYENEIIDKIIKHKLTDYGFNTELYKESQVNLYVNSHYGFNKTCLKERKTAFNKTVLDDIISITRKMKSWSNAEKIFCYICGILSIFDYIHSHWIILENVLKNAATISELFLVIIALSYDNPYEEKMECSDPVSNSNYNVMIEKIRSNGQYIFACFICIIIIFCSRLSTLIMQFIELCTKKGKKVEICSCCCTCCIECCCKKEPKERINVDKINSTIALSNPSRSNIKIPIPDNSSSLIVQAENDPIKSILEKENIKAKNSHKKKNEENSEENRNNTH